ncbi:MAG TPA: ABC transporter substrate-binding protein [Pyrinomonadaceae bacterium]|jgi:ABC-type branched-subunit amino acid transport system substrate-binding protein|nr:ABC transporter substrate-binding protein [Pyrinomonadaceae bacterium]
MKVLPSTFIPKIKVCVICVALLAGLLMMLQPGRRAFALASFQNDLTPQEKRGKQIYVQGTSSSGREILAYLGDASLEVPGSAMACANCHGLNGEGKPEGGIVPSNLTWEALTKPYGVTHASGRTHPPYTERALELAITRGLDPSGHKLLNVMPRYQMSREDMADLIAYLKRLGKDIDPGVSDSRITIGTILPSRSDLAGVSQAIKAVTTAYFDELNSQGGIYNRKVELKFIETADTPATTSANVKRFIQDERVFAMTGAFTAGADRELAALMNELEVPLVGPLTLYPQVGHPLNRHVFYLLSGMDGQARALVNFASQKSPDGKTGVAVVYPESELSAGVLEAIKDQCQKKSCGAVEAYSYQSAHFDAPATVGKLRRTSRNIVFFLGMSEEGLALMKEADKLHWSPLLYLPGAAIGKDVFDAPLSFDRKIFLSFPTSPADQSAEGVEEFRALATKYKLPATHLATQLSAYSAARILVEGLKRTGKELSREKLVETLEGLNQYATGLTPAVTYGPNRRIGAMGAYVITIDLEKKQFLPASSWVNTN